jgi:hypothetical protein
MCDDIRALPVRQELSLREERRRRGSKNIKNMLPYNISRRLRRRRKGGVGVSQILDSINSHPKTALLTHPLLLIIINEIQVNLKK